MLSVCLSPISTTEINDVHKICMNNVPMETTIISHFLITWVRSSVMVKALCYKLEGREFET
jgi:hypothetical protein